MEERKYSRIEIGDALNKIGFSNLEKSLLSQLDLNNSSSDFSSGTSSEKKYLVGKNGDKFNLVSDSPENSFFELIGDLYGISEFTFSGKDEEAIAKRIFETSHGNPIADIVSGNYRESNKVEVVERGRIRYDDGKWRVIKPIKVALNYEP